MTPNVRFKGFTDAWEQHRAKETFISVSEKGHPELPVLSATQEKGMVLRDNVGIDIKYKKTSLQNYKRVLPGQFVIHLRSFQGGFAYSDQEGITSPAYTIIKFKDNSHSALFWKEVMASTKFIKNLRKVTYGIRDGRSISFTDFKTLSFTTPKKSEEESIGIFFQRLNLLIAHHQKKLEDLQQLKKLFLQKIFDQEWRFQGFTDPWEQRKLEQLGNIVTGSTPSTNNPAFYNGSYLFVSPADIQGNRLILNTNKHLSELGFKMSRIVPKGSTFFVSIGSTIGKVGQASRDSTTNQQINTITPYSVMQSDFIFSLIQHISPELQRLTATQAVPILNKKTFSNALAFLPSSTDEQVRIGRVLRSLDDTIAHHQKKLDQLQQLKKWFLQNMFV